jgi:cytochrome c553
MKKLTLALCVVLTGSPLAHATETATATEGKPDATVTVGDAAKGKEKSSACMACHGPDGNSVVPLYPKIAGQGSSYLVDQLHAFKNGTRNDPMMSPMAKPLSDQDILDLAAHYANQTRSVGEAKAEFIELGQKIYQGGSKEKGLPACIACHGPKGDGNAAAKYPSLSGQQAGYTEKQLKDYAAGARGDSGNPAIMKEIALKMSAEEMKAVAEYLVGLK